MLFFLFIVMCELSVALINQFNEELHGVTSPVFTMTFSSWLKSIY